MYKSTSLFEIGALGNASSQPLQPHTLHEAFEEKMIKQWGDERPSSRSSPPNARGTKLDNFPNNGYWTTNHIDIKGAICNNFSWQHSKLTTECGEITVLMLTSWSKAPVLAVWHQHCCSVLPVKTASCMANWANWLMVATVSSYSGDVLPPVGLEYEWVWTKVANSYTTPLIWLWFSFGCKCTYLQHADMCLHICRHNVLAW